MFFYLHFKGQGSDLVGIMTLIFICMALQVIELNGTILAARSTKKYIFCHGLTFIVQIKFLPKLEAVF